MGANQWNLRQVQRILNDFFLVQSEKDGDSIRYCAARYSFSSQLTRFN